MAVSKIATFQFVVWGEAFIDNFVDLTMASLLSPANLPQLANSHDLRLLFYTDRASVAYLQECTKPLTDFATLSIMTFEDTAVDGRMIVDTAEGLSGPGVKHEIERQATFHAIDTVLAEAGGEDLYAIPTGFVASDGSISRAQALLDAGARAVAPPVLRLDGDKLNWSPDALRAGLDHLTLGADLPEAFQHITRTSIATSEVFTEYPASILWPAGDEGFVCRTFFPLTLAFKPTMACCRFDSTIDYEYLLNLVDDPAEIHVPRSSAEIAIFKVSSESYMQGAAEPRQLRGGALVHFLLTETNKAHRGLISQPYRLATRPVDASSEIIWQNCERESAQFLDNVYALLDQVLPSLPESTPGLSQSIKSHFGEMSDYLSPMRRG